MLSTMLLVFNPRARLTLARRQDAPTDVRVAAPVRGRPLREEIIRGAQEPEIVDLLERVAAGAGDVDVELTDAAWDRLAALGLLVPEGDVPSPVRFRGAPSAEAGAPARDRARLRVNPTLRSHDPCGAPFAEDR